MKTLIALAFGMLFFIPSHINAQGKPNFVGEWYQDKARGKSPVRSEAFTRGQSDFPRTKRTNNITANSATLTWAATPSTNQYTVQYKLASASTWSTATTSATSYMLTGLSANTQYAWSVKSDCSPYATTVNFTTLAGGSSGCSAPSNLTSSGISASGATLNWSAVSGATSYTVQYKTTAASTWTSVTTTTNSRALTGLSANTAYVWQVKASCSAGYSSQSTFTTSSSSSGCSAPANLVSSGITPTSATLSWSPVTGAAGYTLQYRRTSTSTWTTVSTTTTSRTISGLAAGAGYVWQVKANCSSYSPQATFTTSSSSSGGCGVPVGLSSGSVTNNAVTLTWSPVSNATSYTIRYKLVGASGWSFSNAVTGTSFRLTGLLSKRNYTWALTARCANGSTSNVSASAYFTTQ